jgi:hypothetical protein
MVNVTGFKEKLYELEKPDDLEADWHGIVCMA